MKRMKVVKAVCVPLAAVLGTSLFIEADSPHVEPRQHEEEPRMTFDSPYTTTSSVVYNFPLFGYGLESIPVPAQVVRAMSTSILCDHCKNPESPLTESNSQHISSWFGGDSEGKSRTLAIVHRERDEPWATANGETLLNL